MKSGLVKLGIGGMGWLLLMENLPAQLPLPLNEQLRREEAAQRIPQIFESIIMYIIYPMVVCQRCILIYLRRNNHRVMFLPSYAI